MTRLTYFAQEDGVLRLRVDDWNTFTIAKEALHDRAVITISSNGGAVLQVRPVIDIEAGTLNLETDFRDEKVVTEVLRRDREDGSLERLQLVFTPEEHYLTVGVA